MNREVSTPEPRWLGVRDVVKMLNLSKWAVCEAVTTVKLPEVKLDRAVRILRERFEQWLEDWEGAQMQESN